MAKKTAKATKAPKFTVGDVTTHVYTPQEMANVAAATPNKSRKATTDQRSSKKKVL